MTEIFSDELIGRTAVTSGGYPVGTVEELVVDTGTGEIRYLLIRPTAGGVSSQKTDSKGRAVVSFSNLKLSGDKVIVA